MRTGESGEEADVTGLMGVDGGGSATRAAATQDCEGAEWLMRRTDKKDKGR